MNKPLVVLKQYIFLFSKIVQFKCDLQYMLRLRWSLQPVPLAFLNTLH